MKMKHLLAALFYSLTMFSCGQTNGPINKVNTMRYEPTSFNEVELNSSTRNACSPEEQDLGWIGIEIKAPNKIHVASNDENIAIPICGLYSLPLTAIANSSQGLEIHVQVKDLAKTYSGFMVDEDYGTDAPLPMNGEEEKEVVEEGVLLEAYFNPDIRDYVSFPLKEGVYSVSVEYGGEVSNEVDIQVILEK
jgi:hypothetical protein